MWRIIEDWIEEWGIWLGLVLIGLPLWWDILWGGFKDFTLIRICVGGCSIQLVGWVVLLVGAILRKRWRI